MLIGVKLFSCMFIYAAHYEWLSFDYDVRWMEIALSPAMAVHGMLMFGIWRFDIDSMAFTRDYSGASVVAVFADFPAHLPPAPA